MKPVSDSLLRKIFRRSKKEIRESLQALRKRPLPAPAGNSTCSIGCKVEPATGFPPGSDPYI